MLTPLDLKLFRDLGRMKGQIVAVSLVMACGLAMMIMTRSIVLTPMMRLSSPLRAVGVKSQKAIRHIVSQCFAIPRIYIMPGMNGTQK